MLQVILVNLLISRKVEGTTWGQTKDSSYKLQELLIIRHLVTAPSRLRAPKLWDSLSVNIRNEENFNTIITLLETHFFKLDF